MPRILLIFALVMWSVPAKSQDSFYLLIDKGLVTHLLTIEPGKLFLYPGAAEEIVPDHLIDQYAPGSPMRRAYEEQASRMLNEGVATDFLTICTGIVCELQTKIARVTLPDGEGYFDHHFQGLQRLRQLLDETPPEPTNTFEQDIADLLAFFETHEEIGRILFTLNIPAMEENGLELDHVPLLHSLFENRHFTNLANLRPQLELGRTAAWSIDLGLFSVPFDQPDRPEHRAARRVNYEVTSTGNADPSAVRLTFSSELDLTVVGGSFSCVGLICDMPWQGPSQLTLEFAEPRLDDGQLEATADIVAKLSMQTETGSWEEITQDSFGVDFSNCDSKYVKAIRALSGTKGDPAIAAQQSRTDLTPVSALPGRLLYGTFPMENAARDAPAPPPVISQFTHQEIRAALTSISGRKLLDQFLSKEVWGADGQPSFVDALEALPLVLECDSERLEALYKPLEGVLPHFADGRKINTEMALQARQTAVWWAELVNKELAEVASEQVFEDSQKPIDDQLLDFGAATELGLLVDMLVELKFGAEAMATTSARVNAVGAVLVTLQALSSAHDLYRLYQILDHSNESTSWLEAAAYFEPMAKRYSDLESRIETLLHQVRVAEAEACGCFKP